MPQTCKVTQLDHAGSEGILVLQFRQRFIEGQELIIGSGTRDFGQLHASQSAAVLKATFATGVVDEDAPHRLGRRREEVGSPIPMWFFSRAD